MNSTFPMLCLETGDGDNNQRWSWLRTMNMVGESQMHDVVILWEFLTCKQLNILNDIICRMLQAGPGSGANPKEIKKRLKTGLDCLKKGLAILEVVNLQIYSLTFPQKKPF